MSFSALAGVCVKARFLRYVNYFISCYPAKGGVRSKFMRSSFPTVTFPNHHSIVTVGKGTSPGDIFYVA